MKPSRIQAVDTVHLESLPEFKAELCWFYGELADLAEAASEPAGDAYLAFQSEQIEVHIRLCRDPQIEPKSVRLTIAVPFLDEVEQQLVERSCPFHKLSGIAHSDRRIDILDPAGNRVHFKQMSRFAPL